MVIANKERFIYGALRKVEPWDVGVAHDGNTHCRLDHSPGGSFDAMIVRAINDHDTYVPAWFFKHEEEQLLLIGVDIGQRLSFLDRHHACRFSTWREK